MSSGASDVVDDTWMGVLIHSAAAPEYFEVAF